MRIFSRMATRRRVAVAAALTTALVAAGAAVAQGGFDFFSSSEAAVTATFTAGTSVSTTTTTCTAANGDTIDITEATFTGTATSSTAMLNGPLEISVKSNYDTKTAIGSVDGRLEIGASTTAQPTFIGTLEGVDSNGTVQGLVDGSAGPGARVVGNVTAAYSGSGFTSGSIGTGTGTNTAILAGQGCAPAVPSLSTIPVFPFFGHHGDEGLGNDFGFGGGGQGDQGDQGNNGNGNGSGFGQTFDVSRGGRGHDH